MTEKIGLEALLDDAKFMAAFTRYIASIDTMERRTTSAAGTLSNQYRSMGDSVLRATGAIGVALVGAAAAGGLALGKLGADSVRLASDMEAQMKGVQAILGITNEELVVLSDLVTDLGIDPALKVSAVEAAEAVEMLARNGLKMDEIMGGAARSTVLLANATGGDFSMAADIATDVMAIFGISAENMSDAVNGITSVTTNSKFTLQDYAYALAQGGGVAASVGVEFDDFNAAIAATSPLFASGSDAGTSLKTMLLRLVPASNTAADSMRALGLITEDGQNQFFDANGQMKSMADIAGILQEATAGLTEEQRNQYMATIFGTDAMRSAVALASTGEQAFLDLKATMGETDAEEAARIRMDNLAGSMEILKGIIETLKIRIGNLLIPVIRRMTESFSAFLTANGPLMIEFLEKVIAGVGRFVTSLRGGSSLADAFFAALSDFNPVFAQRVYEIVAAIETFVEKVVTFVSEHSEAFKGAIMGIGAVIASSAIASAIAGIGAALAFLLSPLGLLLIAAAALGAAWETDFMGMRTAVQGVMDKVNEWAEKNGGWSQIIMEWWEQVKTAAGQLAIIIAIKMQEASVAAQQLSYLISLAVLQIIAWWQSVETAANQLAIIIAIKMQEASVAAQQLSYLISLAVLQIIAWWQSVETAATQLAIIIAIKMQEASIAAQQLVAIVLGGALLIIQWWESVKTAANQLAFLVTNKMSEIGEKVQSAFQQVVNALTPAQSAWDSFVGAIQSFWNWLTGKVFKIDIELPSLPDWATPGSPIPLHTAWKDFSRFLGNADFAPRVDAGGFAPLAAAAAPSGGGGMVVRVDGGSSSSTTQYNLNMTTSQSEWAVADSFRLMERMSRD